MSQLKMGDVIEVEQRNRKPIFLQLESKPTNAHSINPSLKESEWLFFAKALKKDLSLDTRAKGSKAFQVDEWNVSLVKTAEQMQIQMAG